MIDEAVRRLASEGNFAAFTTLFPDGRPTTQIMWVDCDDEHVLINTTTDRAKYRNVCANPAVAVAIWDRTDPYGYAEVRGTVVQMVTGPEAAEHIDVLSRRYLGRPYPPEAASHRVILKIAPHRQRFKETINLTPTES
jgi:PPOX class probable F420-dependent enzyme